MLNILHVVKNIISEKVCGMQIYSKNEVMFLPIPIDLILKNCQVLDSFLDYISEIIDEI